ncbi:RNA 2',3'-cyclic phosphodiesterase [Metapseudomonas furukawaii]|jgi:2'-5' RNA ligase|uniref:RNA 2',3'-cyclic phosphodiesterase n=1 Tax=Metapseudomonas furukawaii TaxID=1149133 RepID=UPI000B49CA28|nr:MULTISPECIES: RNA 2',3'-cyclic phosphodiesterase [Pseudomonas]OWJ95129.1 2'-5' RNA ligase [Pseudomonas sp. A46]WAG81295.1 RNA 2',3'-cyclic phosphodiesterase [Pseudomonas furukawaii]
MTTPPLRLFFALPCPAQLAGDITAWRAGVALEGKPVAPENLHLTLAFLGAQPRGQIEPLAALAASLTPASFILRLDRLARWKNGLLHLAPGTLPPELVDLERQLRQRLLAAGFSLESRAFKPHLTLARHCTKLPGTPSPTFDWPVSEFALFVSENTAKGTRYRVLGQWPLRPQAPT